MRTVISAGAVVAMLAVPLVAHAGILNAPPPSGALLDLAEHPSGSVPSILPGATSRTPATQAWTQYAASFIAVDPSTTIAFAIRNDPATFALDNVVLAPTSGGANLLFNGDFELPPVSPSFFQGPPAGWTNFAQDGVTDGGFVESNADSGTNYLQAESGVQFFADAAIAAYDGIKQTVSTTPGADYTLSFWLENDTQGLTYRATSDDGSVGSLGNGVDVLAYAGGFPSTSVPEPASLLILAGGLVVLPRVRRRHSRPPA